MDTNPEFAAETVKIVNEHIQSLGFTPRDADGNDFQRGDDSSLRFKTGTSHQEVTILPYQFNVQGQAIRVMPTTSIEEVIGRLTAWVEDHDLLVAAPDGEEAIQG